MTPPDTNTKKQARRHIGPLIGMALATLFGVAVIIYWLFEESAESDPPLPPAAEETELGPPRETVEEGEITRPEAD